MILRLATNAMGTRFELALEGENEPHLRAVGEEALREIELWHNRLSAFDPASDTSRINRHAASPQWAEPLAIDHDLGCFLALCQHVNIASDGAFDPTIGHAMEHLGFRQEPEALAPGHADTRSRKAPAETDTPAPSPPHSPPTWLSFPTPTTLALSRPNLRLDFGAIAKGWALDRAADILTDNHLTSALLHGGTSSVIAIGPPAAHPPHTIRVRSDARPLDVLLRDGALGVSAHRGRTIERDGQQLGHVIDPRTGAPAPRSRADTALVTGPAKGAALCDAWSTAALVLGHWPPNLPPGYAARVHTPLGWSGPPASQQPRSLHDDLPP